MDLIRESLDDDKGEEIVVIDLNGRNAFTDYMVIGTGRSSRQVAAMAEHLVEKLKAAGMRDLSLEGMRTAEWVLLDAGDVVVHLFKPETRSFYNIEKMWAPGAARPGTPASGATEAGLVEPAPTATAETAQRH